jgi:putative hemolysin
MKTQTAARFPAWMMVSFKRSLAFRSKPRPFNGLEWLRRRRPVRPARHLEIHSAPYRAKLAATQSEKEAAFRLRFRVFNLELNEGLAQAFSTGADRDEFDAFFDHINVEDQRTGEVIGTYRLQSGVTAARHIGYYSEREFDFAPYGVLRPELIELGRACIHPDHRKYEVLMLLWKAVVRYAAEQHARYLIGCSSLTSQDPAVGAAVYRRLSTALAPEQFRTRPLPSLALPHTTVAGDAHPPKLLRTYLCLGAWICGEPAIDREFKTIDFLTLLDLNNLSPATRHRLFDN